MRRTPRSFTSGGRQTAQAGARAPRRAQARGLRADPVEMLDIYTTKRPNAPINVFIHGGAWRSGDCLGVSRRRPSCSCNAGAHFIVPDFIDVIEAGGSLMPMAEQVRRVDRLGATRMPRASAAIRAASMSPAARRARIWPARAADHRLAEGFRRAVRRHQGRAAVVGHVRSQAGAAVQARRLREVHRRDGRGAVHAATSRRASIARSSWLTAPTKRRSSSARRATLPRR